MVILTIDFNCILDRVLNQVQNSIQPDIGVKVEIPNLNLSISITSAKLLFVILSENLSEGLADV